MTDFISSINYPILSDKYPLHAKIGGNTIYALVKKEKKRKLNKNGKTEKGKTFRPEYVEITDPKVLERIANRRGECERGFSRDKWDYRRDRMPNRGGNEAELFMLITMITPLLTAITAFCVGRDDLIRSTSAFKRLH